MRVTAPARSILWAVSTVRVEQHAPVKLVADDVYDRLVVSQATSHGTVL